MSSLWCPKTIAEQPSSRAIRYRIPRLNREQSEQYVRPFGTLSVTIV